MVLLLLFLLLPRIIKLELRITLCIHASIPIKLDIRLPIHLVEPSAADPLLEEKLYAEEERGSSTSAWGRGRAVGRVVHAGQRRR